MAEAVTPSKPKAARAETPEKAEPHTVEITRGDLREMKANNYLLLVAAETRPEQFAEVHVTLPPGQHALLLYDRLELVPRDERWHAEYLVADSGPGWATLVLLRAVDLPKRKDVSESRVPPGHRIYRGAPDEGWIVHRETDGVTMSKSHATHESALRWLLEHATLRQR